MVQDPNVSTFGSDQMRECIRTCSDCHRICLETLSYCLTQGGEHARAGHIRHGSSTVRLRRERRREASRCYG